MKELKIGTAWIRGIVGHGLTPELVVKFSTAFGTWADSGPIAIGRDTRRSSVMFRSAVIGGLLSTGSEIVDLGICTTPLLSFAVRELGLSGGIMISGSHNDSTWNALKFIGPDGALLNAVRSEELFDIYHASVFTRAAPKSSANIATAPELVTRYLEHLHSALDCSVIRRNRFRIVADFCGGPLGAPTAEFLDGLGCTLVPLHSEPTGEFPHPPAPTVSNMRDVTKCVLESRADLGVGLNIDGDRIGFVTSEGRPLSEEFSLPLAAFGRLRRRPGLVVTNFSSSRMIDSVARRFGQMVERTTVGESSVMDAGLDRAAVLAGEGSGGVGILPVTMTFDALLALGMVLEACSTMDCSLDGLVNEIPAFSIRKGEVRCTPVQGYRIVDRFRGQYDRVNGDCVDGVRIDWENAWLHARVSNTEPLLRVIVEADNDSICGEIFSAAMDLARGTIRKAGDEA